MLMKRDRRAHIDGEFREDRNQLSVITCGRESSLAGFRKWNEILDGQ